MEKITEEQFTKALEISTICAKKGWKHSTDMIIAGAIGKSSDKEKTIQEIEHIVKQTINEEEALKLINDVI